MNARGAAAMLSTRLGEAGIEDGHFEAELIVREAAMLSRSQFFADADLDDAAFARAIELVRRRAERVPASYLFGHREFFGLDIRVSPDVLIPRPETELLVDLALEELRTNRESVVVDVGTGSGCVAAAIATNSDGARIFATDRDRAALAVARSNFERLSPEVSVLWADLASGIGKADVVVANLPYIPSALIADLTPEVRAEPRMALDGGTDGLDLIRPLIDDCGRRLRPRLLALEVMAGQAGDVARLATAAGGVTRTYRDLAGIERVVTARWL